MKTISLRPKLMGLISSTAMRRNRSIQSMRISGIITLMLCLFAFNGLSQEKTVDQQAQVNRLAQVEESIQKIDERLTAINNRLASAPQGSTIDPSIIAKLDALKQERKRYQDVKVSIDALISPNVTSEVDNQPVGIPRSRFDLMPIENQTQILAHPERYTVIENQ